MLLTIHNLPPDISYDDIKSIILKKCGVSNVILDNLLDENGMKKVTVGLVDEGDAALLVRKINGLYVDGHQLYVENVRQKQALEQPYRSSMNYNHSPQQQEFQNSGRYQGNHNQPTFGNAVPNMMMAQNMEMVMVPPMVPPLLGAVYHAPVQSNFMGGVNPQPLLGYQGGQDQQLQAYGLGPNTGINDNFGNVEPNRSSERGDVPFYRRNEASQNYDHGLAKKVIPDMQKSRWNATDNRDPQGPHAGNNAPIPWQQENKLFQKRYSPPRSSGLNRSNNERSNWLEKQADRRTPNRSRQEQQKYRTEVNRKDQGPNQRSSGRERQSDQNRQAPEKPWQNQQLYSMGPNKPQQSNQPNPQGSSKPWQNEQSNPRGSNKPWQNELPNTRGSNKPWQNEESNHRAANTPRQNNQPNPQGSIKPWQNEQSNPRGSHKPWQNEQSNPRGSNKPLQNEQINPSGSNKPWLNSNSKPNSKAPSKPWQNEQPHRRPSPWHTNQPNSKIPNKPGQNVLPNPKGAIKPWQNKQVAPREQPKQNEKGSISSFLDVKVKPEKRAYDAHNEISEGPPLKKIAIQNEKLLGSAAAKQGGTSNQNEPNQIRSLLVKDQTWRGQAASCIAKEMLVNQKLINVNYNVVLKELKSSIRTRIELLVGDRLSVPQSEILILYRKKFPKNKDHILRKAVIEDVRKSEAIKAKHREAIIKTEEEPTSESVGETKAGGVSKSPFAPSMSGKKTTGNMPEKVKLAKDSKPIQPLPQNVATATANKTQGTTDVVKMFDAQKKLHDREFSDENYYKLTPELKKAVDEEIEIITNMFKEELSKPEDNHEKIMCERILSGSLEDFKKVMRIHTIKRLLNVTASLMLVVFGRKLKRAALTEFVAKYGVWTILNADKNRYFVIKCDTFESFDRLCALKDVVLEGEKVFFKPLNLLGEPMAEFRLRQTVGRGKSRRIIRHRPIDDAEVNFEAFDECEMDTDEINFDPACDTDTKETNDTKNEPTCDTNNEVTDGEDLDPTDDIATKVTDDKDSTCDTATKVTDNKDPTCDVATKVPDDKDSTCDTATNAINDKTLDSTCNTNVDLTDDVENLAPIENVDDILEKDIDMDDLEDY